MVPHTIYNRIKQGVNLMLNHDLTIKVLNKMFKGTGAFTVEPKKALPECNHNNQNYQPEERETNIQESLVCDDCGIDLLELK